MFIEKQMRRIDRVFGFEGVFIGLCIMMLVCSFCDGAVGIKSASAKKYRSMARVYMTYGDFDKAKPLAESAVEMARKDKNGDKELSLCLLDLSYIYTKQNDPVGAGEICLEGLDVQKRVYSEDHPYVAYTLKTLSSIYRMQEENEEARGSISKAITIMGMYHEEDESAMGPFYAEMGKVLCDAEETDDAEYYYLRALELYCKSYGGEHLCTANLMSDIAGFYVDGERYFDAEPLVRLAMKIKETVYGEEHRQLAETFMTMAKICQAKGQTEMAEEYIGRAFRSVERSGDIEETAKLAAMATEARKIEKVAMAR
ncbi:MAG: tetratricopeptide repeat protein [Anaerohalosphaera sp.]|nr:tetratricopeptide repeat protein [Anaerohalosphaera sp.]